MTSLLLAGCGGGDVASDVAADADGGGAVAEAPAPDTAAADERGAGGDTLAGGDGSTGAADPAPEGGPPALPGEGEPRTYRLLLVNATDREAFIFARADADRVAVDTVPAADSSTVDLRVRADWVDLDAEDAAGGRIAAERLDLDEGSVNRWVIGGSGSLVRLSAPAYPRIRPAGRASLASSSAARRMPRRDTDLAPANGG